MRIDFSRTFALMKLFGQNINLRFWEKRSADSSSSSGSSPMQWLIDFFGGKTISGVNMTEEKALGLSALWAAVRIKADMVATIPFQIYEIDDNGNRNLARNHPINRLIKRPNKHLTSFQFRWTMQALLELNGNAFARIVRNPATYRPEELIIVKPSAVTIEQTVNDEIFYNFYDRGKYYHVPFTDMIHLRNFSCDGLKGISPIQTGKENLALAVAAQEFEASFFGNGAHLTGYLTYPGKLKKEQKLNIKESWETKYAGYRNTGRTPVLESGMEYKRIGLTPKESMLDDSRRLSIEDISRWFNVPLYMLSALDKMSFNNIEQIARDFVNKSLRPNATNWQEEINMKLLRHDEIMTHESGFDFTELLKGDSEKMGEFIRTMINAGVMSIDDGRKMLSLNTKNEAWATKHWIQLNMAGAKDEDRIKFVKNPSNKSKKESKSLKIKKKTRKLKNKKSTRKLKSKKKAA